MTGSEGAGDVIISGVEFHRTSDIPVVHPKFTHLSFCSPLDVLFIKSVEIF